MSFDRNGYIKSDYNAGSSLAALHFNRLAAIKAGKAHTITIAPNSASDAVKFTADVVAEGDNDHLALAEAHYKLPSTGGTINILEGRLIATAETLITKDCVTIIGAGMQQDISNCGTEIFQDGDFDVFRIKNLTGADIGVKTPVFRDFSIKGSTSNTKGGFRFENDVLYSAKSSCLMPLIQRVGVTNSGYGAIIEKCDFPQLLGVSFSESGFGLRMGGGFAYGSILGCIFADNILYGVNNQKSQLNISSNLFARNGNYDLKIEGYAGWVNVIGNNFDDNNHTLDNIILENGNYCNITSNNIKAKRRGISVINGSHDNNVSVNSIYGGEANLYLDGIGVTRNKFAVNTLREPKVGGYNSWCGTDPHYNDFIYTTDMVQGNSLDSEDIYDISTIGNNYQPNTRLFWNHSLNQSDFNGKVNYTGEQNYNDIVKFFGDLKIYRGENLVSKIEEDGNFYFYLDPFVSGLAVNNAVDTQLITFMKNNVNRLQVGVNGNSAVLAVFDNDGGFISNAIVVNRLTGEITFDKTLTIPNATAPGHAVNKYQLDAKKSDYQPDSTATTLAELVADFNTDLANRRSAGLSATS